MKTSNKLLVLLFLSMMAFLGTIHLGLYSQLKNGHIINSLESTDERIRPYNGKAPSVVDLEGNINVNLIPSDTFYVEYQQTDAGHINCGPVNSDSLVVRGEGGIFMNPHATFHFYSDLPWVSVHMGRHTDIRLKGLLAFLKGTNKRDIGSIHIRATDTQLWLGESYGSNGTDYPPQYYDSVQVDAKNTNLVLHRNAVIEHFSARMNDLSEINDEQASINTFHLQYTPLTKISLKGVNLDKLRQSGH